MSIKTEIMVIAELSFDLNAATPEHGIHCTIQTKGVCVTAFTEENNIAWQQDLYEWEMEGAYLPKLRLLRHELERMLAGEMRAIEAGVAA